MDKNRIESAADQGERANNRKTLVVKERWRGRDGCMMGESDSHLGAPSLMPEKGDDEIRSGVSAEAIVEMVAPGRLNPVDEESNEKEGNRYVDVSEACTSGTGGRRAR